MWQPMVEKRAVFCYLVLQFETAIVQYIRRHAGRANVVCPGSLHFANVIETDSLLPIADNMRYVCILYNPMLGAFLQGDDQKIRPVIRGMTLNRPGSRTTRQGLASECPDVKNYK